MDIITLKEIRKIKSEELNEKIIEVKKSLLTLRMKQATRQPIKTHLFKRYKRMLAQMLTIRKQIAKS